MKNINSMFYISIPKTGSNTVHNLRGFIEFNHTKAITISKKVGKEKFSSRGSFCFIRNPFDLIKSWYSYHKYSNRVPKKEGPEFYPDSIDQWILKDNCKTHWQKIKFKFNNPLWDLSNPLFQLNWISDHNKKYIVDNIYSFDNFESILQEYYGRNIDISNKSDSSKIKLSRKSIIKIEELFSKDLELFFSIK